jgi:CBS domain-containing protein
MRVEDLMTRDVSFCSPTDRLNDVSHIMWNQDCGVVPVVDPQHRVVGIITDRDVCMAAYTTGQTLRDLAVERVMSHVAHCCHQTDTIDSIHQRIRELQVRRLPVVDAEQKLVGLIGLGDLARAAAEAPAGSVEQSKEFATTFAAASRPRKVVEKRTKGSAPPARAAAANAAPGGGKGPSGPAKTSTRSRT